MSAKASGSCLCGAIRYVVTGPLRPVVACHCRQCRKTSGHHVAATSAPVDGVEITGAVSWFRSSERAERGFCPTCGSNLFWRQPDHISIFAGTLDTYPGDLKLAAHIFCKDKGSYYDIEGDVPQIEGGDDVLIAQLTTKRTGI